MNRLFLFTLFLIIPYLNANAMTQDEYMRKIQQWHQSSARDLDFQTFEKGITWFLDQCNGSGSAVCNTCLLMITQPINGSTAKTWVGTFSPSGPINIISTATAINDGRNNHSKTPGFAGKIGQCQRGATQVACNHDTCWYVGGYHGGKGRTFARSSIDAHQKALGGENVTNKYMYAIPLPGHGQIMFHDGFHCHRYASQGACSNTWGCIDQYPSQQKALCNDYIDKAGGLSLYIDYNNNTQGSRERAAQALSTKGSNLCQTRLGPHIAMVTPLSPESARMHQENAARFSNFLTSGLGSELPENVSEQFENCVKTRSSSYGDQVQAFRDNSVQNACEEAARIVNGADTVYGGAEQNDRAITLYENCKDCDTQAATELRSSGFINYQGESMTGGNGQVMNNLSKLLADFYQSSAAAKQEEAKAMQQWMDEKLKKDEELEAEAEKARAAAEAEARKIREATKD